MLLQDHEKVTLTTPMNWVAIYLSCFSTINHKNVLWWSVADHRVRLGGEPIVDEVIAILADRNANLSPHQKELMLWHQRLGHLGLTWLQKLMKPN